MHCTSYVPVYYHAKSVNVGGSGFSCHPFDNNANCGEERGCKISMPTYNMDGYVGSDKEMLKQIIQNHEATFRNQVPIIIPQFNFSCTSDLSATLI